MQPLASALTCVHDAEIQTGETVAVIRSGVMGYQIGQLALHQGASKVYAIDVGDRKIQVATEAGLAPFTEPSTMLPAIWTTPPAESARTPSSKLSAAAKATRRRGQIRSLKCLRCSVLVVESSRSDRSRMKSGWTRGKCDRTTLAGSIRSSASFPNRRVLTRENSPSRWPHRIA